MPSRISSLITERNQEAVSDISFIRQREKFFQQRRNITPKRNLH